MILVPFNPALSADQELRMLLGDELAVLRITWNTACGFWYLSLSNADATAAVNGLKMVPGWPLFSVSKALAPLAGDFMVLRMDDSVGDAVAYDDLGVRWGLYYLTDEEVAAWRSACGLE